ncbi:hypothetical protein ACQPX6_18915 [Actinomycetospora sp. CA-101289]|uniref:hypothetical protein n=1 Tax=Actinomycetospora sp. CA-101289 TaxID=3239893 RepID=UPI003D96B7F7
MPPPADDAVARSADTGRGDRPEPSSLVRAVVDELVETAVTIGEDVELVLEDTVGEVLAAGERSLRVLRTATERLEAGHPPLVTAGETLAALGSEAARAAAAVAVTSGYAGRHAGQRAGTAVGRIALTFVRP